MTMPSRFIYEAIGSSVTVEVDAKMPHGATSQEGKVEFRIRMTQADSAEEPTVFLIGDVAAAKDAAAQLKDAIDQYNAHHKLIHTPAGSHLLTR